MERAEGASVAEREGAVERREEEHFEAPGQAGGEFEEAAAEGRGTGFFPDQRGGGRWGAAGRGCTPAAEVVALLGFETVERFFGDAAGADIEEDGEAVDERDASACGFGVVDCEPAAAPAGLERVHGFELEAVWGAEDAEEEFGAELVEAVAEEVVPGADGEEMAADADHFEGVAQGGGEVEDVFERAAVADGVELAGEVGREGLVEVVDDGCVLVGGGIEGFVALGAEDFPERLGIGRVLGREEAGVGGGVDAELAEQGAGLAVAKIELLAAEGEARCEGDPVAAAGEEEAGGIEVDGHEGADTRLTKGRHTGCMATDLRWNEQRAW